MESVVPGLVSIITVNYNHPAVTEAMLHSVFQTNTYANVEIIVVDNGSETDPVPQWELQYIKVHFIRSHTNLGFAGGNNLGVHAARGEYLFLVNNDTEFTTGLIETLLQTLKNHPETGITCPKIKYFEPPQLIQYVGFTPLNYITARNICLGNQEPDRGQYDHRDYETAYAHGAAMMVRRSAADKVGLMAENFFLYYEEFDWCERFRKAGFTIRVNTDALIFHKESVSVGRQSALKEYFMNRNRMLLMRKHAPTLKRWCFYIYFICIVVPRNILAYIRNRQPEFIGVLLKAIRWNLTHSVSSSELGYPVKQ